MALLTTPDLYLSAYLVTEGARLKRVVVSRADGRTKATAIFEVEAAAVQDLASAFFEATATVNLAAYRQSLSAVKDAMFAALRAEPIDRERRTEHEEPRAPLPRSLHARR